MEKIKQMENEKHYPRREGERTVKQTVKKQNVKILRLVGDKDTNKSKKLTNWMAIHFLL